MGAPILRRSEGHVGNHVPRLGMLGAKGMSDRLSSGAPHSARRFGGSGRFWGRFGDRGGFWGISAVRARLRGSRGFGGAGCRCTSFRSLTLNLNPKP